jgi:hypothetical protein
MTIKVFCKLADCVNWDRGFCGADEIRIDREGYCATYEEIPEEVVDELDLAADADDVDWEEDEEELEIKELNASEWTLDKDEDEEEDEEEESADDSPWSI